MLDAFAARTAAAPIGVVVNTHANGDHCYGNELVAGAEIIASTACAEEMAEVAPAMLAGLNAAPGEVGDLFRSFFGDFQFDGITLTPPTRTFDGRLTLDVAGREVELIEVGPAHTKGDTLVHVPDARTVFTGDILFIGGTPIVWAGPLANWVAACDLMLGMDVDVVVPGPRPADRQGRRRRRARLPGVRRHRGDRPPRRRARRVRGGQGDRRARSAPATDFGSWGEAGRIAVNVETVYRTLDPTPPQPGRRRAVPAHGRARPLTGDRSVDVAVVGDGPAGLALAAAAGAAGLDVVVVGDGRPWTATYGTWRDDVAGPARRRASRRSSPAVVVHGHRRHVVERPYGDLRQRRACATTSAAGVDASRRVPSGSATCAWGSTGR